MYVMDGWGKGGLEQKDEVGRGREEEDEVGNMGKSSEN